MKYRLSVLPIVGVACQLISCSSQEEKPNVVFILADDIGYCDLGCYGATKISTPNIDSLANAGVRFTHGYAPASTSSPSRYALLTGEYAWRKNVGIMPGDAPMSIDIAKNNLPKQMKAEGYKTAIVGKWHLGLGEQGKPVDFNRHIDFGMEDVGFDYSFIFPATNDRVPTIYIENDMTVGLDADDPIQVSYTSKIGNEPTGKENSELLTLKSFQGHDGTIVNGIGRMGWMTGGHTARWKDEDMNDVLLGKAKSFIKENKDRPFFLYYAAQNAHEPRVSSQHSKGKSAAGIYGDVIQDFDYCVGQIVQTLRGQGVLDNTIIIISSDNGPMIKEGYLDGALENLAGHNPYGELRGKKYSLYEGGVRVPLIVHWSDKIKEPFVQEQGFCFMDVFATLVELTHGDIEPAMLNDSKSAASLILEKECHKPYREYIITQNNPGHIALRHGEWKYIPAYRRRKAELYNLKNDSKEAHNLIDAKDLTSVVNDMKKHLKEIAYTKK